MISFSKRHNFLMLINIAVLYRAVVIFVYQMLADKLRKGDRAVLSARTADGNYKLAFALLSVERYGAVDKA